MKSVISVKPLENHKLLLEFDNGEKRIGDITPLLSKAVFAFLKDDALFNKVYIEYGAVTWKDSNGMEVDICPDKLYIDSVPV